MGELRRDRNTRTYPISNANAFTLADALLYTNHLDAANVAGVAYTGKFTAEQRHCDTDARGVS
jgi:hypothetical protein